MLWFVLFLFSQLLTFSSEKGTGLSIVVAYIFPAFFLFFSFIYGNQYKISKAQYVNLLHCIIAVAAYSAIYALIFKTEQFLSVFSIIL